MYGSGLGELNRDSDGLLPSRGGVELLHVIDLTASIVALSLFVGLVLRALGV